MHGHPADCECDYCGPKRRQLRERGSPSAGAFIQHVVRVLMTPKDLREIADAMERVQNEAKVGETAVAKKWIGEGGLEVWFVLDTDRAQPQYCKPS
jgi:hypothetical protein